MTSARITSARITAALVALALAACGGAPAPVTPAPAAPAQVTPAPFPYTPAQLRAANPAGRKLRYRVMRGHTPSIQEFLFVEVDADGATIQGSSYDAKGTLQGEPKLERQTWAQLQAHATFPVDDTSIDDSEVTTPYGVVKTKLYTVTQDVGGTSSFTLLHFAADPAWAGPPVAMAVTVGGAPQLQMELVERTLVPPAPDAR